MKSKRRYRLGRRAETALETRRRIVEATAMLHAEKGVSGTSLREIAQHAGVSIGTVYHHFATYDDCIRACAHYTDELVPPPDESIFTGTVTEEERVRVLVRELFAYYERAPFLEGVRAERRRFRALAESFMEFESELMRLTASAIDGSREDAATVMALADVAVFRVLREHGMQLAEAADRIAEVILCWLRARRARPEPC